MSIYQGPVIINSCFFDKYVTKSWCFDDETSTECPETDLITRHAGAISFKRSNNYPSMTSSYVQNNTFGFCDDVSVCADEWVNWLISSSIFSMNASFVCSLVCFLGRQVIWFLIH